METAIKESHIMTHLSNSDSAINGIWYKSAEEKSEGHHKYRVYHNFANNVLSHIT
jgi:hypothetical protein